MIPVIWVRFPVVTTNYWHIAQSAEQMAVNHQVVGSSPARTTKDLMRIGVKVTHEAHNLKFTVQVRGSQPKNVNV